MNIVIPMAGDGQRFKDAGYQLPKPLIDVDGKPMIQRVVENLDLDGQYVFFIQDAHDKQYGIKSFLRSIVPDCHIVSVTGKTQGAAESVKIALSLKDKDTDLFIANSDQLVDFELVKEGDGSLLTFDAPDRNPKWSYCIAREGRVNRVVEKQAVSDIANTGLYWFKSCKYYLLAYEAMFNKQIKTNKEYYVAPVYNELIKTGFDIRHRNVKEMIGLGTPEDLEAYLNGKHNLDNQTI